MSKIIIFVCTGNSCRSPMAEVIADRLSRDRALGYTVASRGLSAYDGDAAAREAIAVAANHGLDLTAHVTRTLTAGDVSQADVFYTMSATHRDALTALFPDAADKTKPIAARDIDDPWSQGEDVYERTFTQLEQAIQSLPEFMPILC